MRLTPAQRMRLQAIAATVTCGLGIFTVVAPQWIEDLFGVDPDGGDGSVEIAIVAVCALVTVLLGVLALANARRSSAG